MQALFALVALGLVIQASIVVSKGGSDITPALDFDSAWEKDTANLGKLIVALQRLVVVSSSNDTALPGPATQYNHLRHPDSFHRSAEQAAMLGWAALSSMHNDMNAINRNLEPLHDQLVRLLVVTRDGKIQDILDTFPRVKKSLLDGYRECRFFSEDAKTIFKKLEDVTDELLSAAIQLPLEEMLTEEQNELVLDIFTMSQTSDMFANRLFSSCEDRFKMDIFPLHEYVSQQYEMTRDSHQFVKADRQYSLKIFREEARKIDTYSLFLRTLGKFYLEVSEDYLKEQLMQMMKMRALKTEQDRSEYLNNLREQEQDLLTGIKVLAADSRYEYPGQLKSLLDEIDEAARK